MNNNKTKKKINKWNIIIIPIHINQYKETNEDLNLNPDEIIKQDYEETTENEYQQLLEKKSQYLETNLKILKLN